MKKTMTHTITLEERQGGFEATYVAKTVDCRLLTHHIVLENGTKYKKSDGEMVGGHKYMGMYMENTKVKPSTLKEKQQEALINVGK